MNTYKPVIGLEIHVELKTKSKMFCQCEAHYFGKEPNTNTCPVCLGLPGALPVPNKKAIEWCILIGKALNCSIPLVSKFDRKHYFYPDLPKGYQISQYDEPIAVHGRLKFKIQNSKFKIEQKEIRIRRVHMEEDTGKLIHSGVDTLVDFNRSGVPLVEIVTEPDFDNSVDVKTFLEELHTIILYLDVSDADMEKGSMRIEPNISLIKIQNPKSKIQMDSTSSPYPEQSRRTNSKFQLPNYKVEVKNINSYRYVSQAIEYELNRQKEILEKGKTPIQETRGFDEKKVITYSQRSKEEAHDYRYFPEPDIPPLEFTKEYIASIKIPELPSQKMNRFIGVLKIKDQDAFLITRNKKAADFFENIFIIDVIKRIKESHKSIHEDIYQKIANFFINKLKLISDNYETDLSSFLVSLLPKETDTKLLEVSVFRIIENNKNVVNDYKNGKQNALMFLVGQVMKEMKGKADAKLVIEELKKKLQ